jgi:hypothetical protein
LPPCAPLGGVGPRRCACGAQLQRTHLCRRGLISWIQKCSSAGLKPGATPGGGLRTAPCKVLQAIWGSLWIQERSGCLGFITRNLRVPNCRPPQLRHPRSCGLDSDRRAKDGRNMSAFGSRSGRFPRELDEDGNTCAELSTLLKLFAVLGRSPDWMRGVQSGERSRVENVRTYGRGVLV